MRPDKVDYGLMFALVAATRATCDRLRVGCAIFDQEGHLISTGYNGSPPGMNHCDDEGHLFHDGGCVRTIHAEQNAIGHAARLGVSVMNCVAYVTHHPCRDCAKLMATAGIVEVRYIHSYRPEVDELARRVSGVRFIQCYPPRWEGLWPNTSSSE